MHIQINHINFILIFSLYTDHEELAHAANGLSFLWQHLTLDVLFYPESDTTNLKGRTPYANGGLKTCCLTNIGSALTIQRVCLWFDNAYLII